MILKTVILILALSLSLVAADKKSSDEIDHIALAALLLKDGLTARAKDELNQVNLEDEEIDRARFYTLMGLVYTKQSKFAEANSAFSKAIKYSEVVNKTLYLYMAQNSFKLKDYEGTLDAIKFAQELAEKSASVQGLKAECYWKLKSENEAFVVLAKAIKTFPTKWAFYKQRFSYYLSLKLYQSALVDAKVYLSKASANEKTVLSFISALRTSGDTDRAIELAEKANIQFVKSAEITVLLAHLYLDKEMVQAAAELFAQASIEDRKYTKEAAEMMRRAKEFTLALYKNSQMLDTKEKLKQRVAIYIEFGSYERIIVSKRALERSELIDDESIRYALAYSYYMTQSFEKAEVQLQLLSRPDLFKKATELRKNMQKCKESLWECTL